MMPAKRLVLAFLGIAFISIFLSTLTRAGITQLSNDDDAFYAGSHRGRIRGEIDGSVFTPDPELFPITVLSVQFGFHVPQDDSVPWIGDSARVRVQIYAMEDGTPGEILAESESQTFSALDEWLSLPLTAPLTIEEPASFMAAVRWESGVGDDRALSLATDSNLSAPQAAKDQLNLYHREDRWLPESCRAGFCAHSELWGEPENAGFNMIRVTIDTPLVPTETPGGPTPTATATLAPQPTPSRTGVYLPAVLRNFNAFMRALRVGEGPGEAVSYALTSGNTVADRCWPGVDNNLWVGREPADERGAMRSVIEFDLGAVPSDAVILEAGLQLVAVEAEPDTASMTVFVHNVTQPWGDCPTWNTLADAVGESWSSVSVAPDVGAYTVDVTVLVGSWLSGDLPNYGLMLRGDEERVGRFRGFVPTISDQEDLRPSLLVRYRWP